MAGVGDFRKGLESTVHKDSMVIIIICVYMHTRKIVKVEESKNEPHTLHTYVPLCFCEGAQ